MPTEYPVEFKCKVIQRCEEGESIKDLSQELNIAQSTIYHWRKLYCSIQTSQHTYMPKELDTISRKLEKLGHEKEIIQLSGFLEKAPLKTKLATLEELYKTEESPYSVRPDAKKQFKKRQQYQKQNLLERQFTAERPNQIWVSDITYFKVNGYWRYFCMILDLFSRKIVGWRVSRNASTNLVTTTFRNAYRERGEPKGLTFHRDRGKQYTSGAFKELLQKCGTKQSFSATGQPHDNAVAETFFAAFKKEEAYRREYTSEQSFRRSVELYIAYYNETRPHRTLKYKTPQAFEDEYFTKKQCSNSELAKK